MATCVYSFKGVTSTNSTFKTAELSCSFTPPPTLDEICYVECTSFTFKPGTAKVLDARDMVVFYTDLASQFSGTIDASKTDYSASGTKPGSVPMGCLLGNAFLSTGPVLCRIPSGPQTIRFTIARVDGGEIASTDSNNHFFATLKIVPANGRQPPIGV
jgi:hypothetical protein